MTRSRSRATVRAMVAGAAAAVMMLAGASAASADPLPAAAGSITGTVTSDLDGAPIADVTVYAYLADWTYVAATTDASGAYSIEGLTAGDYLVQFESISNFISEYWDDARDSFDAQPITVADGQSVQGIDAALAPGGSISGTVTDASGTPLQFASISASGQNGGYGGASTDADGNYTMSGLADDSYTIEFSAAGDGYVTEYWDDVLAMQDATQVAVALGETVTGIDAALDLGGVIEGIVTRESDSSPIADVAVTVTGADGFTAGSAVTDGDGRYSVAALAAGSYTVGFSADVDPTLAPELWDGARTVDDATPVVVALGETTPGIDASLQEAGLISGTVTLGTDGSPVAGAVWAHGEDGSAHTVTIEPDGAYTLSVPAGTYVVSFEPDDATISAEYWDDARTESDAKPITVAGGQHVTGIDAQLDSAALIRGTIQLDSTAPHDTWIEAFDGESWFTMAYAGEGGAYELYVPVGTYALRASAVFYEGRSTVAPQYFDHVATLEEATPVTVRSGEVIEGIDFTLGTTAPVVPGPQPSPNPSDPAPSDDDGGGAVVDSAAGSGVPGDLAATGGGLPTSTALLALVLLAVGGVLVRRKSITR